jgi:hypothetical protein
MIIVLGPRNDASQMFDENNPDDNNSGQTSTSREAVPGSNPQSQKLGPDKGKQKEVGHSSLKAAADPGKQPATEAADKYKERYEGRHVRPRYLCFRNDYTPPKKPTQQSGGRSPDGDRTEKEANIAPSNEVEQSFPSSDPATPQRGGSTKMVAGDDDLGYTVLKPEDWTEQWLKRGVEVSTEYVFVSYSRKQFYVQSSVEEMKGWKWRGTEILYTESEKQRILRQAKPDRKHLTDFGIQAAQAAGLPAFWIDFECIRADPNESAADADKVGEVKTPGSALKNNTLSDASRATASPSGVPPSDKAAKKASAQKDYANNTALLPAESSYDGIDRASKEMWLHQWGGRLWTLPEILLCPTESRVTIYSLQSNLPKQDRLFGKPVPEKIAKRNFVEGVYKDIQQSKRVAALIDHFEGSVVLTPLGLVTTALECLVTLDTTAFRNGDLAYCLMGLLRRRPEVNFDDDDFEAFARLSLANDSDQLLERLICLLPKSREQKWRDLQDEWDRPLWDITPHCQVAGIGKNNTVILDGAFGATIRWHSLANVAFLKRETAVRTVLKFLFRFAPFWLLLGAVLVGTSPKPGTHRFPNGYGGFIVYKTSINANIVIGGFFVAFGLLILLASPYLLLRLYRGKFWGTQAWFFGIEGYVPIGKVEEFLFGFNHNRLKWSTNGSKLSHHMRNEFDECVPVEPDPTALSVELEDRRKKGSKERLSMLVCTYTMTATLFWAERPPVAVLVCGREGGMQRAVLCSYDWKTQTFFRETVVRMKTVILERMFRVDRFRFALSRPASDQD